MATLRAIIPDGQRAPVRTLRGRPTPAALLYYALAELVPVGR